MVHLQSEGPPLIAPARRRLWPTVGLAPILFKDFTIASRRWQTYLGRSLGAGLIGVVLLLAYNSAALMMEWQGVRAMAQAGRQLVATMVLVAYGLVSMSAPLTVIRSVIEEREKGTLGLLLASPLGPWRVAVGKTFAGLLAVAAFTVSLVPPLFLALTFGGTQAGDLAAMLAQVAAGGLLATAIALALLATRAPGPLVVLGTLGIYLAYILAPLLGALIRSGIAPGPGWSGMILSALLWWNPFYACVESAIGFPLGFSSLGPLASLGLGFSVLALGMVILALRIGRERGVARPLPKTTRAERRGPGRLPVFWYETRIRLRRQLRWWRWLKLLLLVGLLLLIMAVSGMMGATGWLEDSVYAFGFPLILFSLVSAAVRGAWTGGNPRAEVPLTASPTPDGRVALEKIASAVRLSLPEVAGIGATFVLAHWIALFFRDYSHRLPRLTAGIPMVLLSVIMAVAGMAALSAFVARATASATRGTAVAVSLFVCAAVGLPTIFEALSIRDSAWMPIVAATNPLVLAGWVLGSSGDSELNRQLGALFLEAVMVSAIVTTTVLSWGPLSRWRA